MRAITRDREDRVRSDMLDISKLLQQLVRACQGHMARQPV